jgi:hypothetical protein
MVAKLTAEQIRETARAVSELNADPHRPKSRQDCIAMVAQKIGLSSACVLQRCKTLGLTVVPGPNPNRKRW